jgi:hypothetical protein
LIAVYTGLAPACQAAAASPSTTAIRVSRYRRGAVSGASSRAGIGAETEMCVMLHKPNVVRAARLVAALSDGDLNRHRAALQDRVMFGHPAFT